MSYFNILSHLYAIIIHKPTHPMIKISLIDSFLLYNSNQDSENNIIFINKYIYI